MDTQMKGTNQNSIKVLKPRRKRYYKSLEISVLNWKANPISLKILKCCQSQPCFVFNFLSTNWCKSWEMKKEGLQTFLKSN